MFKGSFLWRHPKVWGIQLCFLGFALYISNMKPLFSERNGLRKVTRIFGIQFRFYRHAKK